MIIYMSDPQLKRIAEIRGEIEADLSPESKKLSPQSRQIRSIRKRMAEVDNKEKSDARVVFNNINKVTRQLGNRGNSLNLEHKLNTVDMNYEKKKREDDRLRSIAEKQRLYSKSEEDKFFGEPVRLSVNEDDEKVQEMFKELLSSLKQDPDYINALQGESEGKRELYLDKNAFNMVDAEVDSSLPVDWEESTAPDGRKYYINHKTKSTTWIDPRLTGTARGFIGGRSAPLRINRRTSKKTRKALSANDNPRYDPSTLAPIPRQNESRQQFNRRMRRRRTVRTMPRRVNRLITERDLGDYPDKSRQQFNRRMRRRRTVRTMPRRVN